MVTGSDPRDSADGVNTMIRTLVRALAPRRHVAIVVADWNSLKLRRDQFEGLPIYFLRLRVPGIPGARLKSTVSWLLSMPSTLYRLRRLARKENIHVVHLQFASAYQHYFTLLHWFFKLPYVLTLHRADVLNFREQPAAERWLIRLVLAHAADVVAVSEFVASETAATFPGKTATEVVRNGIDTAHVECEAPVDLSFEPPARFMLMAANVTEYKAPDVAIEAWREVVAADPELNLLICGEPRDMWEHCQRLVQESGCSDRLRLLGRQPRSVVSHLMARATGLVFPSRSEGLPYALLEASQFGLACVCTDIPSFREVIDDERHGLLVPPDDPSALAQAVLKLARDPALRAQLGRNLKARVDAQFSAKSMADGYARCYDRVRR